MPDISICFNEECLKRDTCYRAAKNWKQSQMSARQSVIQIDDPENCAHYWPIRDDIDNHNGRGSTVTLDELRGHKEATDEQR